MSIPRAELNALLLLSELSPMVEENLKEVLKIENVFYWTDSAVVHAWVNNTNKTFETYVQSRLEKIRNAIIIEN